jgi:hypothetical protein
MFKFNVTHFRLEAGAWLAGYDIGIIPEKFAPKDPLNG